MSSKEQRRAWVISRLMVGELRVAEAARALGLSERSVRRLRTRLERDLHRPFWLVFIRVRETPSRDESQLRICAVELGCLHEESLVEGAGRRFLTRAGEGARLLHALVKVVLAASAKETQRLIDQSHRWTPLA